MTSNPRGYDFVLSDNARVEIAAFDKLLQLSIEYALNQLLLDPSPRNPLIFEQSEQPGRNPEFVMRFRNLAIYFEMENAYVAAIQSVRIDD